MYVCVCNAIREDDLRHAARRTCGGVDETYAALGKAPQCGSCLDEAEAILIEERSRVRRPVLVAA